MLLWTLQRLKSSNPQIRAEAARKLGAERQKKAVPALIMTLADDDSAVRIEAAKALASLRIRRQLNRWPRPWKALQTGQSQAAGSDRESQAAEYEGACHRPGQAGLAGCGFADPLAS